MDKENVKSMMNDVLELERQICKFTNYRIDRVKSIVKEMSEDAIVEFEPSEIFYSHTLGELLYVKGIMVRDNYLYINIESSLSDDDGYSWCDYDDDGELDFKALVDVLYNEMEK